MSRLSSIRHQLGHLRHEVRRRYPDTITVGEALTPAELEEYEAIRRDLDWSELDNEELERACDLLRVAIERHGEAPLGVLGRDPIEPLTTKEEPR